MVRGFLTSEVCTVSRVGVCAEPAARHTAAVEVAQIQVQSTHHCGIG
jgi:hypothetical protein